MRGRDFYFSDGKKKRSAGEQKDDTDAAYSDGFDSISRGFCSIPVPESVAALAPQQFL
jgi:hypothetical protein